MPSFPSLALPRPPRTPTGLPHTAGANDGDEGFGFEKPLDPKNVLLSSDETRRLQRKIVGKRVERAQGLELRAQLGADRLKDAFGRFEVAQRNGAELAQRYARREAARYQIGGVSRDEYLAP